MTPDETTVVCTDSGYLICLADQATVRQSPSVRDFVSGAIEDGVQVVMDLSGCTYLDSTFLGCLVLLSRRGNKRGGSFSVLATESDCDRLFGKTNLQQVLQLTHQSPVAMGPPVALPATALQRREFGRHLLETHRELAELGGPQAATFAAIADRLAQELGEDSK